MAVRESATRETESRNPQKYKKEAEQGNQLLVPVLKNEELAPKLLLPQIEDVETYHLLGLLP